MLQASAAPNNGRGLRITVGKADGVGSTHPCWPQAHDRIAAAHATACVDHPAAVQPALWQAAVTGNHHRPAWGLLTTGIGRLN